MDFINLVSTSIATCIAELLTIPICTIKTKYQANLNYKGIREVCSDIIRTNGIHGLFRSTFVAILSQIISTATKFTFYEYIKRKRGTNPSNLIQNVINGSCAGVFSSLFTHPFDVVKVIQQNQLRFRDEYKKTGFKIFYRGYTKSLIKNISLTALIFPIYDIYKQMVKYSALASLMSSFTTTVVLHPIDNLKVRHISNQPLYLKFNTWHGYMKYHYRGLHINLIRSLPHFTITMVITEALKQHMAEKFIK